MDAPWRAESDRPLDSYGRLAWAARTIVRNAEWSRTQGVRRLVEEHDMRPRQRAARAWRRSRWRLAQGARGRLRTVPPSAVFIGGVGRSGTTMLMRALAESPEFDTYGDGAARAFVRYRMRPDDEIWRLVDRSPRRAVAFKPLLDSQRIPDLLSARPDTAKCIWLFRDVDAVVRSHVTKFGSQPRDALRRIAAGQGTSWHAEGMTEPDLALLRSLDWDTVTPEDGAALLWLIRNRLYFVKGLDSAPGARLVRYEDLVSQPHSELRAVVTFLGLTWFPVMASGIDRRALQRAAPVALLPAIRDQCSAMADQLRRAYQAQTTS